MRLADGKKLIIEKMSLYILIVFTLSNLWGDIMGINLNFFSRLIITALVGIALHILLTYPLVTIFCLAISTIPLLIVHKYGGEIFSIIYPWVQQFTGNIKDYFSGTEYILGNNLTMFWVLITFCLCVVVWFILMKFKQVWMLPIIFVPIFLYYWYIYVDAAYSMMIMFFILYLILIGGQQYAFTEKKWIKREISINTDIYRNWIRTAFAYGLIIVLLATVLPKGNNVIDWDWLSNKVVSQYPGITEFRDDLVYSRSYAQAELFSFSQTGFQENTELGGPVALKDQLIMEVKSPYSFYLRGNVKTFYRNNRWEKERTKQWGSDVNKELANGLKEGSLVELEISYVNMASYTIFAPYQPIKIISDRSGKFNYDKNYELVKIAGIYKNENYKVQAIIPYQYELILLNDESNEVNPEDQQTDEGQTEEVQTEKELELEAYLQLPEGLSPRIAELGNRITREAEDPYEKAQAIGNYLRSNYDYTLEPSLTPKGKEFVDYFLFEEKQGYCTYFATSMAVLLRTQGIPSRYIEGYRMPDEKNNGKYEVKLKDAHAWVEAYIEPVGWILFEPTPAFEPPAPIGRRTIGSQEESEDDLLRTPIRNSQGQAGNIDEEASMDDLEDFEGFSPDKASGDSLVKVTDQVLKLLPTIFYLLLILGILSRVLYIYGKTKIYYKKLKRAKSRDSIPNIYNNLLHIMGEMNIPIEVGETPYEYSERIISRVYVEKHDFRELTELFIRTKYGKHEADVEEVEALLNYLLVMEKKLRVYLGFWKFILKKYFKGEIIKTSRL